MWTSNRKQDGRTQEAPGDVGVVTLGGDPAGVYLSGERRWVAVYAPRGYPWRGPRALLFLFPASKMRLRGM